MPFLRAVRTLIDRYPKLSMSYRYLRDSWQLYNEPVETPHGFKLIGNKAMQSGQFEIEETKLVKKLLTKCDMFINVGANIGYYCCLALTYNKNIIAFEPINTNLIYLLKNLKANHCQDNAEVYPLALSNKNGIIEIYGGGTMASLLPGWSHTPPQYVTLAPCSTFDTILQSRFLDKRLLILVDVEGAEYYFLQGALSVINRDPKPIWMLEINICEHFPDEVAVNPNLLSTFKLFLNNGYDAYTASSKPEPVNLSQIEEIVDSGVDTLKTHNFLFVENNLNIDFLRET
ncbi:FkbM family methyltransferase [Methylomonas sp. CM2]